MALLLRGAMVAVAWALCALAWPTAGTRAEFASPGEIQVKAAYIYNFAKFVEWPNQEGAGPSHALCIGILGKDPFGDALDALREKTARGRKITVLHFRRIEEVRDCEILFISASERGRLDAVLKYLRNSSTLTVADQEGFCEAGGMINMVPVNNRIGFEINVAAAARARLRISSNLLKLARSVHQ